jgi:hypothetical protein
MCQKQKGAELDLKHQKGLLGPINQKQWAQVIGTKHRTRLAHDPHDVNRLHRTITEARERKEKRITWFNIRHLRPLLCIAPIATLYLINLTYLQYRYSYL